MSLIVAIWFIIIKYLIVQIFFNLFIKLGFYPDYSQLACLVCHERCE
jgi:hypothetical protein